MTDSYTSSYMAQMARFHPQLWGRLDLVPTLAPEISRAVLEYLLGLACQATNDMPIALGRSSLVRLPREWLSVRIELAASSALDLTDDWEYRRYLELCCFIDPDIGERVAEAGLASTNAHVREAAEDFKGCCADFASTHGGWIRDALA